MSRWLSYVNRCLPARWTPVRDGRDAAFRLAVMVWFSIVIALWVRAALLLWEIMPSWKGCR